MENKRKISRIISLAVIVSGITVMAGWVFDITILKSILPAWATMKFSTAINFVLCGINLFFIIKALEGRLDWPQIVIPAVSLTIILTMVTFLLSNLFNIRTGIEDLFIKEPLGASMTIVSGRPSIMTMVNFILIALAGILTMVGTKNVRLELKIIGLIILVTGALAMAGYVTGIQFLYYYIENVSSAMACNTAILFAMLGVGLICL